MLYLLRLEYAALFALSAWVFTLTGYEWYWFFIFLLVPDVGMIGYLAGPRIGAWTYNFTHHLALGALLVVVGYMTSSALLLGAGIVQLGHGWMDRLFGYGLKYSDHFQHTHLGMIGRR